MSLLTYIKVTMQPYITALDIEFRGKGKHILYCMGVDSAIPVHNKQTHFQFIYDGVNKYHREHLIENWFSAENSKC